MWIVAVIAVLKTVFGFLAVIRSVIVSFRLIYLKAEFHLGSASHDDEAREATVSDSQDHPRRSPQCEMH